jgi:hypothetical protein
VDAELDVKQPNGVATPPHLIIRKEPKKLFTLIEPRKNGSVPAK